ncbi:MAG: Obg family GTPase CgtA [Candidatus Yanofskybacteria bacterium RIFCSPLOWO2_01_FULL_49_17]|uniref:GTPase Obg n=1 Tax=Candidatus Yanofskybacteria bacterium RIFCSPLOWO2_01_FULL_49_17 TaxID=1802700 RepID=A0A1F8GRJ2_9BACT|nr:MAG: Obg family GTPase CgtA [Candidatus Yanofskybacteria bacterium RIFCSPLOWO2_01_FULL_49_17]
MLIDDITIKVVAGDGGDGTVAFNKNMMSLGPTGATGGKGGNVYVEGVSDLGALTRLRNTKVFEAEDGGAGGRQYNDGPAGDDLTIKVPIGTVVHPIQDLSATAVQGQPALNGASNLEVTKVGQRIRIAKGGYGGKGNFHFRSSKNTSPKQYQKGLPGETFKIRLELKLIADIGLIGLPNAGKSSLLNELTRAKSKVANYAFTTLEPHLGVYYDLILADLPGIIEGAAGGKGLGVKFLRHVERTNTLFHLLSAESEDPIRDYKVIRAELGAYNPALLEKKEYLFISKSDTGVPGKLKTMAGQLKKLNSTVTPLSIHDEDSLKKTRKILNQLIKQKNA